MALFDSLWVLQVWVPGHELVGVDALTGQQLLNVQAQVLLFPPSQSQGWQLMERLQVSGKTQGPNCPFYPAPAAPPHRLNGCPPKSYSKEGHWFLLKEELLAH